MGGMDSPAPLPPESGSPVIEPNLGAEEVRKPVKLPPPSVGWAILWTLSFVLLQIPVAIVLSVFLAIVVSVQGRPLDELNLNEIVIYSVPTWTFCAFLASLAVVWFLYRGQVRSKIGWRTMPIHQWLLVALSVLPMIVLSSEVSNWATQILHGPRFAVH